MKKGDTMKRLTVLLTVLVLAAVFIMPAAAQDYTIMEIENSMVMGYDFVGDDTAMAQRFGINFNLSGSVDAGFMFQESADAYANGAYLVLKYKAMEDVDVNLLFGNVTTASTGIQVSYKMLSNDVQGIATALRMNIEYIVPDVTAGMDAGIFGASLSLGFGI
jgi:hypothetical protein